MTRKLERRKADPLPPEDADEPGILDLDDFGTSSQAPDDNPFKELQQLINGQGIDTKTLLTPLQVVHMHKLSTLYDMYMASGDAEGARMIKYFYDRFMTLIINKDGLSRTQFIEAIGRGRERAEEARREKLQGFMGGVL